MIPSYKPKICYTFKEYESKYASLLQEFLSEHEDFGEIYFFEREREFYEKCHASANITESSSEAGEIKYSINNGITIGLVPEIHKKFLNSNLEFGWNFELSEKYKATFKRIINFLDVKKDLFLAKSAYFKASNDPLVNNPITTEKPEINKPVKKVSAKWYALLYLLELQVTDGKLPNNSDGALIREEIEAIGKQKIIDSTGQSFYRNVLEFKPDIKDCKKLDRIFRNNWRDTIISLSNNNPLIIEHLKKNY